MIDLDHLAQQTAGDSALQHELLTLFLSEMVALHAFLGGLYAVDLRQAGDDLAMPLHRARGAAAAVGATGLVTAFGRAEADTGRGDMSLQALGVLRAEVAATCEALRSLLAAPRWGGLAKPRESR